MSLGEIMGYVLQAQAVVDAVGVFFGIATMCILISGRDK